MGATVSRIQETYLDIKTALHAFSTLSTQYQALLQRASSPPGLPVAHPTSSYWLSDPPFPDLVDIQDALPDEADIVIIGSGITAAAAARTILELAGAAAPKVVVLEARQICSGATGRNGGHIKTVPYEVFAALRRQRGMTPQRARELVRFQMRHLELLQEVGRVVPEGEVREVETVDLFLEEKDFATAKGHVEEAREWMPEWECTVWEADEAKDKFGVNSMIVGAISYKAGALWPYRLITGIWNDLHERYPSLAISTYTPVEAIATDSSSHPHRVRSSRGVIKARHVLHATNAFAPSLVPSLTRSLTGALAHMTAQRPGTKFPPTSGKRSWSVIYNPGFDYVTQRPDNSDGTPGDLMVGGGFMRSKEQGLDQIGVWDDGRRDAFPTMHLRGVMPAVFERRWGVDGGFKDSWTGILGFTGDTMPFVGRLPPRKGMRAGGGAGEWIAAGFNGEGMVWAWLCGTAVGIMMLGKEEEDLKPGVGRPGGQLKDWFPVAELGIDEARLKRADLRNLAGEAM